MHVVAGVHIATGYDSIDFRYNRAVAQIELCLIEIALSLFQTRLGLLQARGVAHYLGINFVDVALRIAPVEFLDNLLWRQIVGGRRNSKLCGAVEKIRQGLAHRGERLVEIRRHIGEICSGRRHGWQAEGRPRLIDIL